MASIRKRKWQTKKGEPRAGWAVDFVDGQGHRTRKNFPTRRAAEAYRTEIEGQLATGLFRPKADQVTVSEAAELFLAHCKKRMQERARMTRCTYTGYLGNVRNYICPDPAYRARRPFPPRPRPFTDGLSTVTLHQLTARRVGAFRDALRDADVSIPTTRKIIRTLKLILDHAVSEDLIAMNVARGVRVIGRRDEASKPIVPPSKVAMRHIIAAASEDFGLQILFAGATGVRAGELHALRWRHLDLEQGDLTVETRVDAYRQEEVTKTAAGMRTIPLAYALVASLKAWRARTRFPDTDDLVFPNQNGTYQSHTTMLSRKFKPLFKKLERLHTEKLQDHPPAPARFTWHALRHYAISCWIEAGLSPKTVQTFAGHSSLQVTMDRYGHMFRSDDHRRAMAAIADEMLALPNTAVCVDEAA